MVRRTRKRGKKRKVTNPVMDHALAFILNCAKPVPERYVPELTGQPYGMDWDQSRPLSCEEQEFRTLSASSRRRR